MGRKHKHSKDKLYKTVSELTSHHTESNRDLELSVLHRRLKFDTCCLSLSSVSKKFMGLCDQDGFCYVFECDRIINFLEKYQSHPITGQKVSTKDLIELQFHKNDEGVYHCPVIYKLFNQHSKIVVNRKSGHVYSYEAYHQLNIKPKYMKDLLTDEPFEKSDIAFIQDPAKAEVKWNVGQFHYVKNKLKIGEENCESTVRDIDRSSILKSSLEESKIRAEEIVNTFNRLVGQDEPTTNSKSERLDKINSAAFSDGALSSSVTSTVMPAVTNQKAALLNEEQILYPRIKKKGYAQLMTNFGPINLELHCDRTPKTCHNFLQLISKGYYDETRFHRLIKNFILQGGDPTGTGTGGQSVWDEPFRDECHGDLKHEGRGVLAMANSGPNTNKSQFYITIRGTWDHLDGKHTVFGRVVGGYGTLDRIESEVETDKNDRPKKEIKIIRAIKYVDPFEEAQAALAEERLADQLKGKRAASQRAEGVVGSSTQDQRKKFRSGVGAYINLDQVHRPSDRSSALTSALPAKRAIKIETQMSEDRRDAANLVGPDDVVVDTQAVDLPRTSTSLSGKLAALSNGKRRNKQAFGSFENW